MNAFDAIIQYDKSWIGFTGPTQWIEAHTVDDVLPALQAVQAALTNGYAAAGFLAYEAAAGFQPPLATGPTGTLPLVRFGIYTDWQVTDQPPLPAPQAGATLDWQPSLTAADYRAGVQRIRRWIAQGDTYQVNYTWRLHASCFDLDPAAWFHHLWRVQRPAYGTYLQWPGMAICSVSPELFFDLQGDTITCRPMKGTANRGCTPAHDQRQIAHLKASHKDRAENVMIVDMVRNDLGRIAPPGQVETTSLFDVETYPTVLQMTSTVRAQTAAGLPEILAALFPSASITGAPKVHTMELITQLEPSPRESYTGTIGAWWPTHPVTRAGPRHARFNVAIRTAWIDRQRRTATYGTGGGIVWDSDADREYQECRTKALILQAPATDWALFETLLWRPGAGWFLLDAHLDRITGSARFLGWSCRRDELKHALDQVAARFPLQRQRVRLQLAADGRIDIQTQPLTRERKPLRVALDTTPVSSRDMRLYHKTTQREPYNNARSRHPDADEVLCWNERGELTEFTVANLLVQFNGQWFTPPVDSGLLTGTLRDTLVRRGRVQERVIKKTDLAAATDLLWANSVRGFRRIRLV